MRAGAVLVMSLALTGAACAVDAADEKDTPGCENRGETLTLGLTKTTEGGLFTTSLLAATPLPPLQGPNRWTVDVRTSAGEPVIDVLEMGDSEVIAGIYMVEHNHRINKTAVMTDPGVFEIPEFPITMNGYWEVVVTTRQDGASDDETSEGVVFGFCVEN
jgi:hypothetical protein